MTWYYEHHFGDRRFLERFLENLEDMLVGYGTISDISNWWNPEPHTIVLKGEFFGFLIFFYKQNLWSVHNECNAQINQIFYWSFDSN